ncbi:MAG: cytochrome b/b6 domain-containing protein [Pseudomonadota bacterium]
MNVINNPVKVFDLPTRLFHWAFALLFVGAFAIGKFGDDEGAIYPYHMMMGMLMTLALGLRILWGIFGTKYARFSSFKLSPSALIDYFKSIFAGNKKPTLGRNPASSFAAIAMFGLIIALGISGYLMATAATEDQMHDIKEVHEIFATLFLLIAVLHIIGIAVHTITQKDPIGLAMVSGTKAGVDGEVGIENNHALAALAFVLALGAGAWALTTNYDGTSKQLNLFGQTLQLGETEHDEGQGQGEHDEANEKDED